MYMSATQITLTTKKNVKTRLPCGHTCLSVLDHFVVPCWIHFGPKGNPKLIPKRSWKASEERWRYQTNTKPYFSNLSGFTTPDGPRHPATCQRSWQAH